MIFLRRLHSIIKQVYLYEKVRKIVQMIWKPAIMPKPEVMRHLWLLWLFSARREPPFMVFTVQFMVITPRKVGETSQTMWHLETAFKWVQLRRSCLSTLKAVIKWSQDVFIENYNGTEKKWLTKSSPTSCQFHLQINAQKDGSCNKSRKGYTNY